MKKINIQIIIAAILSLGGLAMLFCGVYIEPLGQIHDSLLIGFGEVATFAGALFGIDAAYSHKLWQFINSQDKPRKAKPLKVNYRQASKITPLPPPSKTPTTSSQPDNIE